MSEAGSQPVEPKPLRRCFEPTPRMLLLALLLTECVLWLSQQFTWFAFNQKRGWTVLIAVASLSAAILVLLLWWLASLIFRWRFQYTIRCLALLTVAVVVPFSWLGVEVEKARRQQPAVDTIEKTFKSSVVFDYQMGNRTPNPRPPGPDWLRSVLGDKFLAEVRSVRLQNSHSITNNDLALFRTLPELRNLSLPCPAVTDAGMEHVRGLTNLVRLELNCPITNEGLAKLHGLSQLESLDLSMTHITDAGLAHLKNYPRLRELRLTQTQITDAGLGNLEELSQLRSVDLMATNVSDEGAKRLQRALPKCQISSGPFRFFLGGIER